MSNIAVDFDGTLMSLTDIPEGKKMGNPIEFAKESLKEFRRMGFKIIVFSVRASSPKHIHDWLKFYNIPFDDITNVKPNDTAFFIDDHGVRFEGDWPATLAVIKQLHELYTQEKAIKKAT